MAEGGERGGPGDRGESLDAGSGQGDVEGGVLGGPSSWGPLGFTVLTAQPALALAVGEAEEVAPVLGVVDGARQLLRCRAQ